MFRYISSFRGSSQFTFKTKYPKANKTLPKKTLGRPSRPYRPPIQPTKLVIPSKFRLTKLPENKKKQVSPTENLLSEVKKQTFKDKISNWKSFRFDEELTKKIQLLHKKPSLTQDYLLKHEPVVDDQSNVLCGAQTGTGKTLCFLLPVFDHLIKQERLIRGSTEPENTSDPLDDLDMTIDSIHDGTFDFEFEGKRKSNAFGIPKEPRAIIFAPSRHLIEQITSVAKSLHCKLSVMGIHSKTSNIGKKLQSPVDVLVTSPDSLLLLIKNHSLKLSKVERIVFDEADTLFDTNQLESTTKALKQFKKNTKTLLFSATLPKTLVKSTAELIPDLVQITTPNLHKIPSRIHHDFLNLNQSMTKANLLLETLRRIVTVSDTNRVIIFCNKASTASEVYNDLLDRQYPVILISSLAERKELNENLEKFKSDHSGMIIAVATDMASRGIDTINVGQIINYDFPYNVIDYVHRVGRTGRFDRIGRATSFLTKRDVKLAESIKNSIADRTTLS